ncbi:SHOCT domain-containing protein [Ectobacillus sp. sgz5001026]|uniref:SHOCT domain-containing protein n=1 Tax=Ectobacillus sp. sgz5001026 TaxID=3242473 RepID=UPI0036D2B323
MMGYRGYGYNPCLEGFGGYGGSWVMMGIMFLFLVILVVIFVVGFKNMQKTWKLPNNETNAIDILKERLAKGEITEEEYDRLQQKLK